MWKCLGSGVTSWAWPWACASSSSSCVPPGASSPVPQSAPASGKMVSWEKKWKKFIRRDENSFDCVVKFLMYFYASCSLWDIFWKVLKVRPRNLKNSLISLHSNWIWLSAMPRVTPSLPQANAIYITLKWSSLFKRTLIGRHGSSVSKRLFYPFFFILSNWRFVLSRIFFWIW